MPLAKKFEHLQIELKAIESATNNFDYHNCIGRGGFGKVYKGELVHSKGPTIVAVKRLDPAFGQGNPEFWKEIIILSLYNHENIVSLLGFCDENNEKILVYEYASRGSLDSYLNNDDLTWIVRLKICIGAAHGLAYLHNPGKTQQRVLHRDVKSSNILLDECWNAKISDLGLSKFGPANQQYTFLVSNPVGTIGYCDPLYVETGLLTKESDVYSFGVVLFEVLCGRLCISNKDGEGTLTTLVRRYYELNKINEIVFANIRDTINAKSLELFTTVAYQCLDIESEARPSMSDVLKTLECALEYQLGFTSLSLENTYKGGKSRREDEEDNKRNYSSSYKLQLHDTDCVYFLDSMLTCNKGTECEYRHSETARLNPRDCWYWLKGGCLNPNCAFRHPPLEEPQRIPTRDSEQERTIEDSHEERNESTNILNSLDLPK